MLTERETERERLALCCVPLLFIEVEWAAAIDQVLYGSRGREGVGGGWGGGRG